MTKSVVTMVRNPKDHESRREDKSVRTLIRVADRALDRLAKRSNTAFGANDGCTCYAADKKR
jgi:hypothetical protein